MLFALAMSTWLAGLWWTIARMSVAAALAVISQTAFLWTLSFQKPPLVSGLASFVVVFGVGVLAVFLCSPTKPPDRPLKREA